MANNGMAETKKLALLRILQILQKYSDYNHQMTQNDIANKLYDKYGIEMERKAISRNINLLREAGFEIPADGHGTYLMGSESVAEMPGFDFEESELRLLIDSVLSSNHISVKEADALVNKLSKMGNNFFAKSTQGIKKSYTIARVDTAELFYNISVVLKAITGNKKISFTELQYTSDLKLREKKGSEKTISPFNVVASRGNYYLIGIVDGQNSFSAYRLERLHNVKEIENFRIALPAGKRTELENFISNHPLMSGGHVTKSLMLVNENILGDLVDSFGNAFKIKKKLKTEYYVEVEAAEEELVSWAIRYAEDVEILSPESVRESIRKKTEKMTKRYVNWKQPDRFQRNLDRKDVYRFINLNLEDETEYRDLVDAKTLIFERNHLRDCSFLKDFNSLRRFSLVKNPVEHLPFNSANCKVNLYSLELAETAVCDISFLKKMPELNTLMLGMNPIDDYEPLYSLMKLKKLFLLKSVADEIDIEKIRENNPDCIIKIADSYPDLFERITGRVWKE